MAKVVMTLLVPREKKRKTKYPYAVQMSWTEISPYKRKEEIPKVSARLIIGSGDGKGQLEFHQKSVENYRPEEWRAATSAEQAECSLLLTGNPPPWYPAEEFSNEPMFSPASKAPPDFPPEIIDDPRRYIPSTLKNVYDYPDSGDRDTNNGQHWEIDDNLHDQWIAEQQKRRQFDKEREEREKAQEAWEEAERDRRIAEWGEV